MESLIRWSIVAVIVLYALFIVAMRFKERKERRGHLTTRDKLIAYPVIIVGYPLDMIVNATVATVLFLDLPKELTVSSRLERYIIDPDYRQDWRTSVAVWIDNHLIEPVDEDHIG